MLANRKSINVFWPTYLISTRTSNKPTSKISKYPFNRFPYLQDFYDCTCTRNCKRLFFYYFLTTDDSDFTICGQSRSHILKVTFSDRMQRDSRVTSVFWSGAHSWRRSNDTSKWLQPFKKLNKNIITAWHLPMEERGVIIPPGGSQSHAQNGIVALWVRARTIWASALVFCFGNFPPRHGRACRRKWTVCRGILGTRARTEENPLEDAASEPECTLFCPPQGENISVSAWGEDASAWYAVRPRWSAHVRIAMRHQDMVLSHFPKGQHLSPCHMSGGVNVKGPSCLASYTIRETP